LRVRHTTAFSYSRVVHASYNEARISPLDTASQFTLEHRVEVHPATNLFRYRDCWGSRVHCFDLHQPHTELSVVGTSLVETAQRTPVLDETVARDGACARTTRTSGWRCCAPPASRRATRRATCIKRLTGRRTSRARGAGP
jgi:hypothetical protein